MILRAALDGHVECRGCQSNGAKPHTCDVATAQEVLDACALCDISAPLLRNARQLLIRMRHQLGGAIPLDLLEDVSALINRL